MTTEELEKAFQLGHTVLYDSRIENYKHSCSHIPVCDYCIFANKHGCTFSRKTDILTFEQVEYVKQHYPEHLI